MDFSIAQLYLITDEKQRLYCTGFHSTAGHVIITEKGTTLVVDNRYFSAAKRALEKKGIKVYCGSDFTVLKQIFSDENISSVGVDFSLTTVKQFEAYKGFDKELVDVSFEMQKAMGKKTGVEIKNIAKACKIAQKAFAQTLPYIVEGVTEREVATRLEFNFRMNGASDKSFDTIVAFGKNSAVPHHQTGETKLKKDTVVLMDFGCLYNGYCSDMTRTFVFGKPSAEFKKAYSATLRAHEKCYENARAGMTGAEIDKIARDSLIGDGYGEYFTHSLGHGIGVNIHEYPWVSPKGENVVENGMVFSIEPGVYLDGKFGIRIEDTVMMKDGKPSSFMSRSKKLFSLSNGKLKRVVIKK